MQRPFPLRWIYGVTTLWEGLWVALFTSLAKGSWWPGSLMFQDLKVIHLPPYFPQICRHHCWYQASTIHFGNCSNPVSYIYCLDTSMLSCRYNTHRIIDQSQAREKVSSNFAKPAPVTRWASSKQTCNLLCLRRYMVHSILNKKKSNRELEWRILVYAYT